MFVNITSRVVFLFIFVFVVLCGLSFTEMVYSESGLQNEASVLQGEITLEASKSSGANRIQPGSSVKLKFRLENTSREVNAPGTVYVRYAFAEPLQNHPGSILFQTEKVSFPSITPGGSTEIAFSESHTLPSLIDFVRYDWPMREYQAIIEIEGDKKIAATAAITFSAYYYSGMKKEYPIEVSSTQK